jgi:exonuclease SbcD
VTLPWLPMTALLADDRLRESSPVELERYFRRETGNLVRTLLAEVDPGTPAVFLGHLTMEGGRFGSERSALLGNDPVFALDELGLLDAPIDYVALGHLHSHQVLHHRPPVVYAGSVERIDFGEEREEKGFVLVTIEPGQYPRRVSWQFRPLRTRTMRTLRFDLENRTPMDELREALQRRQPELLDAIVRLYLRVPADQAGAIRPNEVRRWLLELGVAHVAGILVETERVNRTRIDVSREAGHDPVTLLERWVALRSLPEEFAQAVIARGRQLIERAEAGEPLEPSS